jgi:hypothetical protein
MSVYKYINILKYLYKYIRDRKYIYIYRDGRGMVFTASLFTLRVDHHESA